MIRDVLGAIVPAGRVVQERLLQAIDGATPAWLQLNGTGTPALTYVAADQAPGAYAQLATSAANGDFSRLETVGFHKLDQFEEVSIGLEGLSFSTQDPTKAHLTLVLSRTSGDGAGPFGGTNLFQNNVGGGVEFRNRKTDNSDETFVQAHAEIGRYQNTQNLTFALRPRQKVAYMLRDGEVVAEQALGVNFSANALVRAKVIITTREAVAHYLRFRVLRLRLVSN